MLPFVRRTHLSVSILDEQSVEDSWSHMADAVILDLDDPVPITEKASARSLVEKAISKASRGGSEVFVRINRSLAYADIEASVWPGLNGIVCPGPESASEIEDLDIQLTALEKSRGIPTRSLQIIVLLQSGTGVWKVREIVRSSTRISSVGLDEMNLCRHFSIVPDRDFDPFVYANGRIIIEGRAAKVHPIGIIHPFGMFPLGANPNEVYEVALRSKNMGFAGMICTASAHVEPFNRALTPSPEQLQHYRETRRLFAAGVARGTAAVPYPGTTMMIDVPVDERARLMLGLGELCNIRDSEKSRAMAEADGYAQ